MSSPSPTCRNCGHRLAPWDHFCSQCGQDTHNHPPTLWEFVHEWLHHYVALEGSLWRTLWGLMVRPGYLTLEYLAGRKQRFVPPLRLVLTLGIVFFLLVKLMPGSDHLVDMDGAAPNKKTATSAADAAKELRAELPIVVRGASAPKGAEADRTLTDELPASTPAWLRDKFQQANAAWRADPAREQQRVSKAILALLPYAVLFSIPFYAGLLTLVHWGSGRTYGAHFVFALHLHAAWYGCCLLGMLPLGAAGPLAGLWANVYPVVALKRVYPASWPGTLARAVLLFVLHAVLIVAALLVVLVMGALGG